MKKIYYSFIYIIILLGFLASCKSDEKKEKPASLTEPANKTVEAKENPLHLSFTEVGKDKKYLLGDKIKITGTIDSFAPADTLVLFINNKEAARLTNTNNVFEWDTQHAHTGKNKIELEIYTENKRYKKEKNITLYSDLVPEEYGYKVKNVYKHDVHAYTQGLFYHKGYFYEATGLKGQSTVRKVKPETGEVLQSFAIPKDIFGEGITLFKNKIIQLSWNSGRGFVYDFENFKQLDEFTYGGEGWGLCNDEKYLYMTNGSAEVKIIEPETYSVIDRFEVFDDKGSVKYLNELEYIDGYIFANIYQYEKIVKFDPKTGQVIANIDLSDILPMNDYKSDTDVLNGIAYDNANKRLFVTGKNWPKLFEIELVKK